MLKEGRGVEELAAATQQTSQENSRETSQVMPKGRNFH
jgi:hypothetical protein